MKILLVATNREKSPFPVSPLGVLAVAGAARNAGFQVDFLDMMFEPFPTWKLKQKIKKNDYGAICFGIRNLDNCFYTHPKSFFWETKDLVECARKYSPVPIILGGSGFSVVPHGWMKRLPVDYGVVAEGEKAFVDLLTKIDRGVSGEGTPGVITQNDLDKPLSKIPGSFIEDLSNLNPPAHDLCDYRQYARKSGYISIQAKRGCPFKCQYCVYPQLEGSRYRLRPVEAIVDEIEKVVKDQKIEKFFFSDSVFNAPRSQAHAICVEMIRRKMKPNWMSYCNSVGFDEDLAKVMKESGCIGVEFGLDAAVDKMLVNWKKPFQQDDIKRSMAACEKTNLPFALHLLFGGPDETVDDIRETQDFLDTCPTPNAVFASLGIRIYEGAPIAKYAKDLGVIDDKTDLFFPTWFVSPHLGKDPISLLDPIARRRDEWSTPTDWNRLTVKMIQKILEFTKEQPQWLNIRNYGKHMRRKPV